MESIYIYISTVRGTRSVFVLHGMPNDNTSRAAQANLSSCTHCVTQAFTCPKLRSPHNATTCSKRPRNCDGLLDGTHHRSLDSSIGRDVDVSQVQRAHLGLDRREEDRIALRGQLKAPRWCWRWHLLRHEREVHTCCRRSSSRCYH